MNKKPTKQDPHSKQNSLTPKGGRPALAIRYETHEILLSDKAVSQAWECLYHDKNPRLKCLKQLGMREWETLEMMMHSELENAEYARNLNQMH
jgi:hypothetical protein